MLYEVITVTKESYEGLEDADEFEYEEMVSCDNCGVEYFATTANLTLCECGSAFCDRCSPGIDGENEEAFDRQPEEYRKSFSVDQYGDILKCPVCTGYYKQQLGESYEGLEDADEFDADDDEVEVLNVMGFTPDSLGIPPELSYNFV